jgi:hypothetical protein
MMTIDSAGTLIRLSRRAGPKLFRCPCEIPHRLQARPRDTVSALNLFWGPVLGQPRGAFFFGSGWRRTICCRYELCAIVSQEDKVVRSAFVSEVDFQGSRRLAIAATQSASAEALSDSVELTLYVIVGDDLQPLPISTQMTREVAEKLGVDLIAAATAVEFRKHQGRSDV